MEDIFRREKERKGLPINGNEFFFSGERGDWGILLYRPVNL
jgi:hypothetical protein